jgi:hypothetical protein
MLIASAHRMQMAASDRALFSLTLVRTKTMLSTLMQEFSTRSCCASLGDLVLRRHDRCTGGDLRSGHRHSRRRLPVLADDLAAITQR